MPQKAKRPSAIELELTRRGFVAGAGVAVLGLSQAVTWLRAASEALAQAETAAVGLSPGDPEVRATMEAFADTIVPGPAGGADALPGAVEAGAVDELYDPFYGVVDSLPLVHQDLQLTTPRVLGRLARFELALSYPERERVVLDRITAMGDGGTNTWALLYGGAAILIYVAYHGTAHSDLGPRTIGFPPASKGYWPRHSYRVRFRRMTKHGNPR